MEEELTKNEKISRSMTGRKLSGDHKKNIAEAKKGHIHTNLTKEKIKKTLLGEKKNELGIIHPLVPKSSKSRSHLTAENVKEIRDRYSNEKGTSIRLLANEYGVSRHTIHSIVTYKIWK